MPIPFPLAKPDTQAAVTQLVQLYEQLSPEALPQLGACYAPDARFKDPFNHVRGVAAITQVFTHMFATLERPRFVVLERLVQGDRACLTWEFHFRLRRWRPQVDQCIRGATMLHFDADGRVASHRDYWDAAEELYEKLPGVGTLMRWLKRAAGPDGEHAAHQP